MVLLLLVTLGYVRSLDPMILAFRKINVQLAVATANAGRLRRAFLLLRAAMRASLFTGPGIAFTAIAAIAIPAIIHGMERAREEARKLEEAFKSLAEAAPGAITLEGTPDLFQLAGQEIERIEEELKRLNSLAERHFQAWLDIKEATEEAGGATREQLLTLEILNEEVSLFSKQIEDLTKEKIELQVSLGVLPPGD